MAMSVNNLTLAEAQAYRSKLDGLDEIITPEIRCGHRLPTAAEVAKYINTGGLFAAAIVDENDDIFGLVLISNEMPDARIRALVLRRARQRESLLALKQALADAGFETTSGRVMSRQVRDWLMDIPGVDGAPDIGRMGVRCVL